MYCWDNTIGCDGNSKKRDVFYTTNWFIGEDERARECWEVFIEEMLLLLTFNCMPAERAHEVQTENIRSSKEGFCTEKGKIVGKKLIPGVLEG